MRPFVLLHTKTANSKMCFLKKVNTVIELTKQIKLKVTFCRAFENLKLIRSNLRVFKSSLCRFNNMFLFSFLRQFHSFPQSQLPDLPEKVCHN